MSVAEDEADVARVLSGDLSAFEGIVRRWQAPLVNLAYRFCRDRGRAEDMAQQAFLRAYRTLGGWRREAAFSTWLFAIATNVCRTELRRNPAVTVPLDAIQEPHQPGEADGDFADRDRDDRVRRAVAALPPKYRDAVTLFYFHGMNVQAAARSLGLPEGTVKTRLARGRDILRRKLPRMLGADGAAVEETP